MIKTIKLGGKNVQFSTSFAWTLMYKSQFNQDPAKILVPALRKLQNVPEEEQTYAIYEEIGVVGLAQIAWSMARLVDRTIQDPMNWILSFGDDFDALILVQDLLPAAVESCFTSKNLETPSKKELGTAPETEKSPE